MEPIEFSLDLTEIDVALAQGQLGIRWRFCLYPGIILTAFGLGLIFVEPDWRTGPAVFATGVGLAYCGAFVPFVCRMQAIRDFRKNPGVQGVVHYRIFDDHFTVSSRLIQAEVRWPAVLKAKLTRNFLALFLSPKTAYLIPFAYLTPDQAAQLRETVRICVVPDGSPPRQA